jgi:PAS domain S-box-containing protein
MVRAAGAEVKGRNWLWRVSCSWVIIALLCSALVFAAWLSTAAGQHPQALADLYTARYLAVSILLTASGFLMLVWQHREASQAQAASELEFRALVEATADGYITADRAGVITYANPAAHQMFRMDRLVGLQLVTLMPAEYREAHTQGLLRFLATGETVIAGKRVNVIAQRATGEQFPACLCVQIIKRGTRYYLGVIHDLSEEFTALKRLVDE